MIQSIGILRIKNPYRKYLFETSILNTFPCSPWIYCKNVTNEMQGMIRHSEYTPWRLAPQHIRIWIRIEETKALHKNPARIFSCENNPMHEPCTFLTNKNTKISLNKENLIIPLKFTNIFCSFWPFRPSSLLSWAWRARNAAWVWEETKYSNYISLSSCLSPVNAISWILCSGFVIWQTCTYN